MAEEPGFPGLRRPRRTSVRRHFAALYTGLFLASGAVLLTVVALVAQGSSVTAHAPGDGSGAGPGGLPAAAQARIASLEHQLAEAQTHQTQQLLLGSAAGLAVAGLLSVLLGWYAAGRVLRPVRAMTEATRRISAENLHERLAVPGPHDELRSLGDTIDGLLARLEGSFAAQRRFVADASHELRTPLAVIRASVDVALAKPGPVPEQTRVLADRVGSGLDQVDGLLEGLLALARAQHGDLPDVAAVSLDELAAAALAERAIALTATGLTATGPDGGSGAPRVRGSRTLLRRLVENLVDNAIRHNEDGGWLRVGVTADGDRAVRLLVENGGRLLTQDQVAELVLPFRRLGPARTGAGGTGSGLGLSIAAAVAEAHRGVLAPEAREDGGLRVVVTLPADDGGEAAA